MPLIEADLSQTVSIIMKEKYSLSKSDNTETDNCVKNKQVSRLSTMHFRFRHISCRKRLVLSFSYLIFVLIVTLATPGMKNMLGCIQSRSLFIQH